MRKLLRKLIAIIVISVIILSLKASYDNGDVFTSMDSRSC